MHYTLIVLLILTLAGCAATPTYNPMESANKQELLLNQSSFKAIHEGMSLKEVHEIMGQELTIGYAFKSPDYKPLSIPNPYKIENMAGTNYLIEYYIESIRQPDGIVSDNELMPLIYQNNKLIGRGWPMLERIRLAKTSA